MTVIGQRVIRRKLNVPEGTSDQRWAWADASEPWRSHTGLVVAVAPHAVVVASGATVVSYSPEQFEDVWENA